MTPARTVRLADLTDLIQAPETVGPRAREVHQELRAEWGPVAPGELSPGVRCWFAMGYAEFSEVIRNEEVFSRNGDNWSAVQEGKIQPDMPIYPFVTTRQNSFHNDGELRQRLRSPIDRALSRVDEHGYAAQVRGICNDLVDDMLERGEADLVQDYAVLIPLLSVAAMFGMGREVGDSMRKAAHKVLGGGQLAQEGVIELAVEIVDHIARRRRDPSDDLTSHLIDDPGLWDDNEIMEAMIVMIIAGNELTIATITQTLLLMLSDDRFAGRLRGGRLDVDQAIEEVMWRDPPCYNITPRFALRDVELGGQLIRKGDAVVPCIAAANLDPLMTGDDPWLEVGNRAHMSWSAGPHSCPAQRPGTIIVQAAVRTVVERLPEVSLAVPADQVERNTDSLSYRYPTSMPVRFVRTQS
jgi:cytochrome P450